MKNPAVIVPDGLHEVLLHACCAPCSSAIVEWMLANGVRPTIFYYNPNIYPHEEYEIRKNESKRHAESLGIRWIDADDRFRTGASQPCGYEAMHNEWLHAICGLEQEPERGKRCERCFYVRLKKTAEKAQELGIPYFATTLASSRWKNLEQINAAGMAAAKAVNGEGLAISGARGAESEVRGAVSGARGAESEVRGAVNEVRFWAQNWRKDGLQERRNALLKEYQFYNQQYCGCEFSKG